VTNTLSLSDSRPRRLRERNDKDQTKSFHGGKKLCNCINVLLSTWGMEFIRNLFPKL
jgi:hypothetical protein